MSNGSLKILTSVLITFHVVVAYVITGQPFHHFLHSKIFPTTLDKSTMRGTLDWFIITAGYLVVGFIISNSIPFFEDVQGLIGSLVSLNNNKKFTATIKSIITSCKPSNNIFLFYHIYRSFIHSNSNSNSIINIINTNGKVWCTYRIWLASYILCFHVLPRGRSKIMERNVDGNGILACIIMWYIFFHFSSFILHRWNSFICFCTC